LKKVKITEVQKVKKKLSLDTKYFKWSNCDLINEEKYYNKLKYILITLYFHLLVKAI